MGTPLQHHEYARCTISSSSDQGHMQQSFIVRFIIFFLLANATALFTHWCEHCSPSYSEYPAAAGQTPRNEPREAINKYHAVRAQSVITTSSVRSSFGLRNSARIPNLKTAANPEAANRTAIHAAFRGHRQLYSISRRAKSSSCIALILQAADTHDDAPPYTNESATAACSQVCVCVCVCASVHVIGRTHAR